MWNWPNYPKFVTYILRSCAVLSPPLENNINLVLEGFTDNCLALNQSFKICRS